MINGGFMDDFLYNLRRETDKRNRRQSGQQQYRGPDRRGAKDPRRGFPRRNDPTAELLPEIKALLETLNENQKKLISNEKRKTLALENIAASLRMMSGNNQPIEEPEEETAADAAETAGQTSGAEASEAAYEDETAEAEVEEDTEDASETPLRSSREEIRKIALGLRDQGKTYKEIAQYLDDEKIPTFSGKGGWHAPTIHKLCK